MINKIKKLIKKSKELFLIAIYNKEYKNYQSRLAGDEHADYTKRVAHYEVHGSIHHFQIPNGKKGRFKLLTWLPFIQTDEAYGKDGEETKWQFLGFKDTTPVSRMTFEEFLSADKELREST